MVAARAACSGLIATLPPGPTPYHPTTLLNADSPAGEDVPSVMETEGGLAGPHDENEPGLGRAPFAETQQVCWEAGK